MLQVSNVTIPATKRFLVFLGALLVLAGLPAGAQTPRETAISFARSAEALGREGDFDGAIRLFQKAWDLAHDPVLLYNKIGRASCRERV